MREYKRERGFLTIAQNGATDYLRLAYGLALSLKVSQPEFSDLAVMITPGMKVPVKYRQVFDEVIDIPWGDAAADSSWKLENEWKAYHATPYRETIKLDADMLFPESIHDWWPLLAKQDVMAATRAIDYRGRVVTSDQYRKAFTTNSLPNVYTAMMYFKGSDLAHDLFTAAEMIFNNWQRYFETFLEPNTRPQVVSTDVVFALAMRMIDAVDGCTFPSLPVPEFVHMKTRLQGWAEHATGEDWTGHVEMTLTDDLQLKIGRHRQLRPVHYHVKSALTDEIIAAYEKELGL